jgi:hypothetical protein
METRDVSRAKELFLKSWIRLRRIHWHQWGRLIAAMTLLDQALGPVSSIPSSEAIIVACIGALFAPIPVSRESEDRR